MGGKGLFLSKMLAWDLIDIARPAGDFSVLSSCYYAVHTPRRNEARRQINAFMQP